MKYTKDLPTIGMTTRCNKYEREQFEKVCKKYNVTISKGIQLLVRLAISKNSLPISHDYENKEHLPKKSIPNDALLYEIVKFIQMVEKGNITNSDGKGYISDGEYMYYEIYCNIDWLIEQAQHYKYVCWFYK